MKPVKLPVTAFTAPSGLHVVIEQDPTARIAGVVAVVGAGAAQDPAGKDGLAHLVEHLTFRARPDGKSTLANLLNYAGAGDVNATTDLDLTTYYAFGPKESLEGFLTLLGSQVGNPLANLDEATFEAEREVVRNEIRERTGQGDIDQALGWMLHAVFPEGSTYSHGAGGDDASVSKLTLADAQAFVKANYRASNMTLVVAGNVTPAEVGALMDRVLPPSLRDPAAAPETPRPVAAEPPAPPPHDLYRFQGPVETPTLYLVWSIPPAFGDNDALETLLAHQLNDRLGYAFYKDDDILSVHAELVHGAKASLLYCEVQLVAGAHPEKTADSLLDQAFQSWAFAKRGDFYRQRSVISTSVLAGLEGIEDRAIVRGQTMQLAQDPEALGRAYGQLAEALLPKVEHFSAQYLSRDRARMVFVTPAPGTLDPPRGTGDEALTDGARVKYQKEAIARIAHGPGVGAFRSFVLPNGLKVAIGQRPGWPQVSVALTLDGGQVDGVPPGSGVLSVLASQDPDSRQHGIPELYGMVFGRRQAREATGVTIRAGGGNIANALAQLSDRLGSLRLPSYVLTETDDRFVENVFHQWSVPEVKGARALGHALFGDAPAGHLLTPEELSSVTSSDVGNWLDRTYDPRHGALAIVGDVDPVQTEALVRDWLGDWKGTGSGWSPKLTELPTSPRPRVLITPKPGGGQTGVTLACAAPAAGLRQTIGMQVLAEVLSEHLDRTVRQTLGASYGFHPSVARLRGGYAELQLTGQVDPTQLPRVLRELHHRWVLLPIALTETEINQARWGLARRYAVSFPTDMSLATAAADVLRHGDPLSSVDDFPQTLNDLTRAELQTLAKTCAQDAAISVVGEEKIANAALTGTWQ